MLRDILVGVMAVLALAVGVGAGIMENRKPAKHEADASAENDDLNASAKTMNSKTASSK